MVNCPLCRTPCTVRGNTTKFYEPISVKLFGVRDAVIFLKITRQGVNKAINEGRLKAFKIGNAWIIEEPEIKRFIRDRRNNLTRRG